MTLRQEILKRNREIERILEQAARDIGARLQLYKMRFPERISASGFYSMNKGLERQIDVVLEQAKESIQFVIEDGIADAWGMANADNSKMVKELIRGVSVPGDLKKSFFQLNLPAMEAFMDRKEAGLKLSGRVWNMVAGAKDDLGVFLGSGIAQGKSAGEISRDVRKCLQEPEKLFRRVRNEKGDLVWSKAAKAYHPGQGVYRSSYKNAMRLARTEVNASYRTADYIRRQQLPFVKGIEVRLSGSHDVPDICDEMAGEYPVGFEFTGWHPQCLCYTVSILPDKDEFRDYLETGELDGMVNRVPPKAMSYLKENKDAIQNWANPPDWVNNFALGEEGSSGVSLKTKMTIQEASGILGTQEMRLGKGSFDLKTKQTSYEVFDKSGNKRIMTAKQIEDLALRAKRKK